MRTSVSIDDSVAGVAQAMADKEVRGNFSLLCEKALREYCASRGVTIEGGEEAELIEAAKGAGGIKAALCILARHEAKKRRRAVA